jgi:hypothetical protein
MPYFYYSPNANASTKPENVPFTEAELGSHVLQMCPIQWQDQYNMNKKGMTPMDLRSLLTSLEAIKQVCTHEKAKSESSKKLLTRARKERNILVPSLQPGFPRKSSSKSIATCARSMEVRTVYTTYITCVCCRFEKGGKEKSDICTTKKGGKKENLVNQNFAQLTKKIEKLKKVLKKSSTKAQKR